MQKYQKSLLFFSIFLCYVMGHGFEMMVWGALNDPPLETVSSQPRRATEKRALLGRSQEDKQEDKNDDCCLTRILRFCGLVQQPSVKPPKTKKRRVNAPSSSRLMERDVLKGGEAVNRAVGPVMSVSFGHIPFNERRNPESDF